MAEIPCIYCITEVQELTEQNVLTNCDGIDITFMEECFHLSAIEIRVKYYHRAKASKGMENNQEDEEKSKEADDNYKDGGLKRGICRVLPSPESRAIFSCKQFQTPIKRKKSLSLLQLQQTQVSL